MEVCLFSNMLPATANRFMALIKYIFSLAEKWEVIEKNPARDISKLEENNIIERYLSAQETQNLLLELKRCDHPIVPDLIEFLILTGARKSEATKAKWSYMDIENGIWTVFPYLFGLPEIIDKSIRPV